MAGHRCALPATVVRSVVRAATVRPLANAPTVVDGLLNVHGEVLPVFQLRPRFGLEPRPAEPDDHFVITVAGEEPAVLRADRVLDLVDLPAEDLRRIPAAVSDLARRLDGDPGAATAEAPGAASGVAAIDDDLLLIFDLASFLSEAEAEQLARAREAAR